MAKTIYGTSLRDFEFNGGSNFPSVEVRNGAVTLEDEELADRLVLEYPQIFTNKRPKALIVADDVPVKPVDEEVR